MERVSIFDFPDYRSYLRSKVAEGMYSPSGIRQGNLDRLAEKLGYRSPSSLSMVLSGERPPSENLIQELSQHWRLPAAERDYLRLLVQFEKAQKKGKDVTALSQRMQRLNKKNASLHRLAAAEFEYIKDWHFLVIRELVYTADFQADPHWISRRLRRKITLSQARHALETLEQLGLLVRDDQGKLRPTKGFVETNHDIPSLAIRQHHKGMLQRAAEALDEQAVDKRQFGALTLRVDPARIPEVKEALLKTLKDFHAEFASTDANSVYQLSLQFFEHTKPVGADPLPGEDEDDLRGGHAIH